MKRVVFSIALAASLAFLGCSKKSSPEDAVKAYFDSFKTGDYEELKNSVTTETFKWLNSALMLACKKDEMPKDCFKKRVEKNGNVYKNFEIVKTEKIDDKHAYVLVKEYKKDGSVVTEKVPVVKTEKGWKVSITK